MLIKSLYLRGYKPLALNQIESITVDIITDLTLILGTNGSGKSSLLRELTPYPAIIADYREGGEKTITLSYNNNEYVLSSRLGRTAKHSFIRNGIELNSGHTTSIQKELVEKEFNYTIMAHRLLIGELKFTAMPASQRREILTTISSVNLEYALYLYKLIKETLRDTQGAVKHITAKTCELKTKQLNFIVPDNLTEETLALEQQLNKLIPYANAKPKSKQEAINLVENNYTKLTQIASRINKIPAVYTPQDDISNNDILNSYIGHCLGKIESAQSIIDNLTAEIENLNEINNSVSEGTLSIGELQHRIAIIERELLQYQISCFVDRNHELYLQNLINLVDAVELIHSHFHNVTVFTELGIDNLTQKYTRLQQQLTNIGQKLENIRLKKQHYTDSSHNVNCPRCKLRFDLNGVDSQAELLTLNQQEAHYRQEHMEASKAYELAELDIVSISAYKLVRSKYMDLHRTFDMPFEFWDTAPNIDAIISNPIALYSHISLWKNNITNGLQRLTLLNELSTCNRALQLSMKYNCNIDVRLAELNEQITKEITTQQQLTNEVVYGKLFIKTVDQYTRLEQAAIESLLAIDSGFRTVIDATIQQDAKSRCDSIYASLAKNKQLTMELEALTRNINELDIDGAILSKKQIAFNLLDNYLSPTKGLIAEQMLGFIGSYIGEMNNIMRSIWEYQLEIKLCNLDNGVLDYTFPLMVEGEQVPDISFGSTGQVDIINLAFTMVMRQYLGITDFPLYLDETGASFDEVHRTLLMRYILMLIESKQCSQVFMINHYTAVTGGLTNHDVVVLDDRNITTPADFNTNVTITYRN